MTVNVNRDRREALGEADGWIKRYYGLNFWGERWGPFGEPEAIVERARAYAEAGAGELIFRFASWRQEQQLTSFCETVLPALQ